jgi:peptidoglycan hydrolase CwlO-like protein
MGQARNDARWVISQSNQVGGDQHLHQVLRKVGDTLERLAKDLENAEDEIDSLKSDLDAAERKIRSLESELNNHSHD